MFAKVGFDTAENKPPKVFWMFIDPPPPLPIPRAGLICSMSIAQVITQASFGPPMTRKDEPSHLHVTRYSYT